MVVRLVLIKVFTGLESSVTKPMIPAVFYFVKGVGNLWYTGGMELVKNEGSIPEEKKDAPMPGRHYTAADLVLAEFPDPGGYLGGSMFNAGQMSMIGGDPGAGKSFVTMLMAERIATGTPFGGWATKKGRVLYISQEMNEPIPKRRMARLFEFEHLIQIDQDLRFCFQPNFDLKTPEGRKTLYEMVKYHSAKVVFIDCFRMVHSANENSNDEMAPWMNKVLERTCIELGAHVSFIHHLNRKYENQKQTLRGATCIPAIMDTVLYFLKDEEIEGTGIIRVGKIRDGSARLPVRYTIADGLNDSIVIDFAEAS